MSQGAGPPRTRGEATRARARRRRRDVAIAALPIEEAAARAQGANRAAVRARKL